MKKKNLIKIAAILIVVIGFSFTKCTKNKINEGSTDTSTLQQLSKDQSNVQSASDDALNDANNVMTPGTPGSSKGGRWRPPNSTLDSTSIVGDTITYTITYNGNNGLGSRFRTGTIIIKKSISTPWFQQGATVYITFVNYRVTKLSNNKTITLNGTKKFVNVSGGLALNLIQGSSVIQEVSGTLQITFDDSTKRTWTIARRRTFTGTWLQLIMTTDGFGSSAGYSNLESYGVNRNGELFYTQINQSIVRKLITCGLDPTSGILEYQIPSDNKSATVTFGYDNNNQPTTSCPTKYKLDWVKNGNSGTIYLPI